MTIQEEIAQLEGELKVLANNLAQATAKTDFPSTMLTEMAIGRVQRKKLDLQLSQVLAILEKEQKPWYKRIFDL